MRMSAEIQQKLSAAHKQWRQEHDTVVQETVKQALVKAKHEYEGMYVHILCMGHIHNIHNTYVLHTYIHTYVRMYVHASYIHGYICTYIRM